jgi:hypothetical protein
LLTTSNPPSTTFILTLTLSMKSACVPSSSWRTKDARCSKVQSVLGIVMVSTSGAQLLRPEAVGVLVEASGLTKRYGATTALGGVDLEVSPGELLASVEQGILVMPGALFETPGFFRICLTATEETCERSLPGFAAALTQAATVT